MSKSGKKSTRIPFLYNQFVRFLKERKYKYRMKEGKNMRINIISPDAKSGWIIYKFGKSVYDQLIELGYDATLSDKYDPNADINHYFMPNNVGYSSYSKVDKHSSFMITHVDTALKLDQIKQLTDKGAIGVCMSLETRDRLIANGVRSNRICYINPAQDGQIKPRKISLGFTNMVHNDNRKRDDLIIDVCKQISPDIFRFVIMGAGWEPIIAEMNNMGFEVEYYPQFDKQKYNVLMTELDYYCYFGFDEGAMGYLDAVAAGIGTIVTPQGYHLDTDIDITYPVKTLDDIVDVLQSIENKRKKCFQFATSWTWENYTLKHIEIWKYMCGFEDLSTLLQNRGRYIDGIFSLMLDDLANYESFKEKLGKV